jgi:hypothetical protein
MPQITGFSPRVYEAVRQFYESRPVFRLEQRREIDTTSPMVRVTEGRCERCGLSITPTEDTFPADTLRAVTFVHDWQPDRSRQCGGQVAFVATPVLELAEAG